MQAIEEMIRSKGFNLILAGVVSCVIAGCVMPQSDYVLKTPEQLVSQLQVEYPDAFVSRETIAPQDAGKIVGEWEHIEAQLLQFENSKGGKGLQKQWIAFTYQFFPDGTFNQIARDHLGVSSITQGTWLYKEGVLETWFLKDNILQRQNPFRVIWHSDALLELRHADIDAFIKKHKIRNVEYKFRDCNARYEANGCFISQTSFSTEGGVEVKNINVMTPIVCRRVADVMKPPSVGMQNPIVHDEELKAKLEAERLARQHDEERNAAMALAIAQGANAFSAEISKQQQHQPVMQQIQQSNNPTASTSSKQTSSMAPKTFSNKRKCYRHGIEYNLATGCPMCKAPKFGLDWEVKCTRCGYWHVSGNRCHICK